MCEYFKMNSSIFDLADDKRLTATQFRVLAVLYSLRHNNSSTVTVRQSVLAQKCGYSTTATIGRAVAQLLKKGLIVSAGRKIRNGKFLGTYTYQLLPIAKKGYFFVSNKALALLTAAQTRMYLFLCKCARSKTHDLWNSYSDIAKALKLKRNAVVCTIKELVKLKIVGKRHTVKQDGSFTDNTYTIIGNNKSRSERYIIDISVSIESNDTSCSDERHEGDNLTALFDEFVEDEQDNEQKEEPMSCTNIDSKKTHNAVRRLTDKNHNIPTYAPCQVFFAITKKYVFSARDGP